MKNKNILYYKNIGIYVLLFLVSSWQLMATDYFVDATKGNDANNGRSATTAYKTISKAVANMSSGDVCYIAGGVYRETVTVSKSNLTFQPLGAERVIITGTEIVSNWSLYKNGIYKADMSSVPMDSRGVTQVFFDKQRMEIARFPNNTSDNLLTATIGNAKGKIEGNKWKLTTDALNGKNFKDNSAKVWHQGGDLWWSSTGNNVSEHSGSTVSFNAYKDGSPNEKSRYFIYNSLQLIDVNKEWFYDNDNTTLYFKAPNNVNPESKTEVRVRENAFRVTGSNNKLLNLHVYGATIEITGSENLIDRCRILFPTPFFQQFSGIVRNDGSKKDGRVSGVLVAGSKNTIQKSEVGFSWGDGITVQGTENTIEDNNIHDIAWNATEAGGIYTSGSKHTISYNKIHELGRSGIVHRKTWDSEILHNEIFHYGYLTNDNGGTYCFATDAGVAQDPVWNDDGYNAKERDVYVEVAYNWIHDTKNAFPDPGFRHGFAKEGLYLDNRSANFRVHHNVVWNVVASGLRTNHAAWYQKIYNNTFWNVKSFMSWDHRADLSRGQQIYNNLSNAKQLNRQGELPSTTSHDKNVNDSQVKFADLSKWDFRLVAGSSAINKGVNLPYLNVADGKPDLGAYELGANWIAGSKTKKTTLPEWFGQDPVDPNPDTGDIPVILVAEGMGQNEVLELRDGTDLLAKFTITSTSAEEYKANIKKPKSDSLQLYYNGLSDVRVDYLKIQENTYQAEDYINTASWSQNGSCGSIKDEWMYCDGSIYFTNIKIMDPKTTSEIIVKAKGKVGTEDVTVIFNNSITKNFSNISTAGQTFSFTIDTPEVTTMRMEFPGNGPASEDLTVDYISVDKKVYQTEDQTDNIGSWVLGKGCEGNQDEVLHCPGRVIYDMSTNKSATNVNGLIDTFSFFPNPANDILTIHGADDFQVQIIDLNGRVVYKNRINNKLQLSVGDFIKGMYLVTMITQNEKVTKKLIVQ